MSILIEAKPRIAELDRAHDAVVGIVVVGRKGQRIDIGMVRNPVFRHRPQQAPDLGRQHVGVPRLVAQEIAEAAFRKAEAVEGRGIEIAQAGIPGDLQRLHRRLARAGSVEPADRRAAEADLGYFQRGAADTAFLHAKPPSGRCAGLSIVVVGWRSG